MEEALLLFRAFMSLPWSKEPTIFLMLNKIDLFKLKIAVEPIEAWWPDFTHGDDCYAALCYFTQKFLDLNRRPGRAIHVLYTDATNTESFRETIRRMDDILVTNPPPTPDSYKKDAYLAAASSNRPPTSDSYNKDAYLAAESSNRPLTSDFYENNAYLAAGSPIDIAQIGLAI